MTLEDYKNMGMPQIYLEEMERLFQPKPELNPWPIKVEDEIQRD